MESHASINSIPNEVPPPHLQHQLVTALTPPKILLAILDFFRTAYLLPLAAINHRFSSLVLRIIHQRLIRSALLPNHRLILECYHPSAKLSTPYLFCDHLFTSGLDATSPTLTLAGLRSAYSHFRPVAQDENQRARRRYPRTATEGAPPPPPVEPPTQDIFLDESESLSQLCTVTNLVPKPGLFLSHVNIGEGVVRVWRDWLAAQAHAQNRDGGGAPILWADALQSVGVRFRVRRREGEWLHAPPVLVAAGEEEEMPVAYRLEFVEVVVRAGELLLGLERSEEQGVTTSGTAVMIVSG